VVEYGILGPLEVRLPDGVVSSLSSAQRLALSVFLVAAGRVVATDRLIEELWGDEPPADPAAALRNQLSRLRRVLGPASADLVTEAGGYRLGLERSQLDAGRFEELLGSARQGKGEEALAMLEQALALWRGPALGEFADRPFAQPEAVRLEELRLAAEERRAELLLALDRAADAVTGLSAVLAEHPHREGARALLMQGLYRQGRHTDALATYQSWRRHLAEELGLEPSPALQRLEREILRHEHHVPIPPSLEGNRHNLPPALSRFVGRRAELEELGNVVVSSRLVTLAAVGGAGKTRLAIQLGTQVLGDFPDGVFLVEFAPLADPALVPRQVAAALGMAVEGIETLPALMDRLSRYLQARHLLLLFDNCEHLVGAIAALTETILARCPQAVVLATSREPLGIAGERIWRVPSLSGDDGMALFCQRAREAAPDFMLTPVNAPAVEQICRRLDGIPLAIELAAARLSHLSPAQVAERLDDRFRLLTGGARTALPRHQTLLAAMEWSYELLSEAERAVLRRLSVFPAGFSLEAAEAVGAAPGDIAPAEVLDVIGHLVDKSLVVPEHRQDEVRYRLLETVRQYAAERLADAGEAVAARGRHRDFYGALADDALSDLSFFWDARRWLPRVRADHDNFWAALEWSKAAGEPESCLRFSVALSYYWFLEGIYAGKTWLEWALDETAGSPPASVRVRGLVALAFVVLPRGEGDRAVALLEEARALADTTGDVTGGAMAREVLGLLTYWRGEFDAAREFLEEARRRFETEGCFPGTWACGFDLGYLAMAEGDRPRARVELERALEISRSSGSEDLIAHSLAALAPLVALDGEAERAEVLADEAIEVARAVGLRLFLVMALVRAGEVAVALGRMDRADDILLESLGLLRDIGGDAWVADTLELAALAYARTDPRHAARLLGTCRALAAMSDGSPSVRAIRDHVEQCRAGLSTALGPETFAAEHGRGRDTPVDQAVAAALAHLTDRRS
jgi:predicted ATPase/DNA-binding SARP family transcriptional activator